MTKEENIRVCVRGCGQVFPWIRELGLNPEQLAEAFQFYLDNREKISKLSAFLSHGYWETYQNNDEVFFSVIQDPWIPDEYKQCPHKKKSSQRDPVATFIYLMKCHRTGLIKIGRSKKPAFRERTLQSEKPDIELIRQWGATEDIEAHLHAHFDASRVRGEWFQLTEKDIDWIGSFMEGRMNPKGNQNDL